MTEILLAIIAALYVGGALVQRELLMAFRREDFMKQQLDSGDWLLVLLWPFALVLLGLLWVLELIRRAR